MESHNSYCFFIAGVKKSIEVTAFGDFGRDTFHDRYDMFIDITEIINLKLTIIFFQRRGKNKFNGKENRLYIKR